MKNDLIKPYIFRIYSVIALITLIAYSSPVLAFIPVLFLCGYLFYWWHSKNNTGILKADCLMIFAIPTLFSNTIPWYFALLTGLPLFWLVVHDLQTYAPYGEILWRKGNRAIFKRAIGITLAVAISFIFGIIFDSLLVIIFSSVFLVFFGIIIMISFKTRNDNAIEPQKTQIRIITGATGDIKIPVRFDTKAGSLAVLECELEWVKIRQDSLRLNEEGSVIEISVTPPLAGTIDIPLHIHITDRWGLLQSTVIKTVAELHVTPRARYAEWIAKKYLSESRSGQLPMLSTVSAINPLFGYRSGVEYYGSQLYQPGDSLRSIDWKHSAKYNKLICKEFADQHGQNAVLLINTSAGDAEDMDKLIFNIITTAISLAKEQIPSVIAAYDENDTVMITRMLPPQSLVSHCLELSRKIAPIGKKLKFLESTDISKLRADIRRLESIGSESADKLAELLEVEYQNLKQIAAKHPAGRTIVTAMKNAGHQSSLVIISDHNHDSEALTFHTQMYRKKGNAVITVS